MKNIVSLTISFSVALLAMASVATADVPTLMQYQGFLTDEEGEPLNDTLSMTFTIYPDAYEAIVIWTETQPNVIVTNGLFHVLLGSVNPISDTVFAETERWLGITVDPDPEIVPRTRLVTVPYAYRAATVDGASGGAVFGDIHLHSILTVGSNEEGDPGRIEVTDGVDPVIIADGASGQVGIGGIDGDAQFHVGAPDRAYAATFKSAFPADSTHVIHAEFVGTGLYDAVAVYGTSFPSTGYGCGGWFEGGWQGVVGYSEGSLSMGVWGEAVGPSVNWGVRGDAHDTLAEVNYGVYGAASAGETKYGVYGKAYTSNDDYAGFFFGNVHITGTLSGGKGSSKIDHPLDPEERYLYHSFVESPDMKNIYDGVVLLDANGEATVELPDYFEAVNKDFRYQLTAIGAPGPNLYIAHEISGNRFKIAGGQAGMKVSWLVTGIRSDPFAEASRIQVEVDKPAKERGKYLHPEAYGLSEEFGIHYEQHQLAEKLGERTAREMHRKESADATD
jgi:hypothetical protein